MEWLGLGGLLGAGGELFSYNRQNFMFDGKMRLEREYQGQSMRIAQYGLYRDDIRDLVELSVSKMDSYLVINTILLSVSIILFTEGKPWPDVNFEEGKGKPWPLRTIWLYSLCNVGAILYFLLSTWLAMHASIAAHSYGVRMLTQFVRLPVPTRAQLDAARAQALDYESQSAKDFLRVPLMKQQFDRLATALEGENAPADGRSPQTFAEDSALSPQAHLDHVRMFREMQANWMGFDAYARVCMMMGVNQTVHALAYYCLGVFIIENRQPLLGLGTALALLVATWLIVKLDIYVSTNKLLVAGVIFLLAPILEVVSLTISISDHSEDMKAFSHFIMPFIFAVHIAWILFMLAISRAEDSNGVFLPINFRSVTYLDVYGWTKAPQAPSPSSSQAGSPIMSPRHDPLGDDRGFALEAVDEGDEDLPPDYQEAHLPQSSEAHLQACQTIGVRLSCSIARWENSTVTDMLGPDARNQVSVIRTRFDQASVDLHGVEARAGMQEVNGRNAGERDDFHSGRVWLKLNMGSTVYFCVETEESDFEIPQAPDCVSEIEELEKEVELWAKHVQIAKDSTLEVVPRSFSRHSSQSQQIAPTGFSPTLRTRVHEMRRDTHDEVSSTSSHPSLTEGIRNFGPNERSQLSLQGLQLANHSPLEQRFMNASSFQPNVHPNRRIRATATGQPRRPPGEVPCRTFCQGSIVLVLVWSVGLIWNTFNAFNMDIPLVYPNGTHPHSLAFTQAGALGLDVFFASDWPHAFFSPTGLACHSEMGDRLLIAERYGVHELSLQAPQREPSQFRPALEECLASEPAFHAAGIDDISIQCDPEDGTPVCFAFLLSVGHQHVLQCPLGVFSGSTIIHLPELHSWRAFATGLNVHSFWGLTSKGILELQRRQRASKTAEELVALSIAAQSDLDMAKLHVVNNNAGSASYLLAMDGAGSIRAWPLQSRDQQRVPAISTQEGPRDARWVGMCSTDDALYTIGESRSEYGAKLRRRPLQDVL